MTIAEAKYIDLRDLMSRLGHEPTRVTHGGAQLFFRAPWRSREREGSLHATRLPDGKWVWYDFGEGSGGGSVVDLIVRMNGVTVGEALRELGRLFGGPVSPRSGSNSSSFDRQRPGNRVEASHRAILQSSLELIEVLPLRSGRILNYLAGRGIPSALATNYLQLIRYRNRDRPADPVRYGFGQVNLSGGYEVRSALDSARGKFQTALNGRDVSLHPGRGGIGETISVFEGMLDHLSLLVYLSRTRLRGDALVLHSLSSYERACDVIRERGYARVELYFDNDAAGRSATGRFAEVFGAIVVDRSPSFAPHADLNDALRAGHDLELE